MAVAGDDVKVVDSVGDDVDAEDFAFAGERRVEGILVVEGDGAEIVVGKLSEDFDDVGAEHELGAVFVGYQAAVFLFLFQLLLMEIGSLFLLF